MPAALLLIRLLAALAGIHGVVRVAGHGQAVAGVHVIQDGDEYGVTDSLGRYSVQRLQPGEHEFQFVSSRFETRRVTILLTDGSDLSLDIELTPRPMVLPPLDAIAGPIAGLTADNPAGSTSWHEAGHFRFDADWQSRQPAGGVDLMQAIARLPGVSTHGDNSTALSIRGGRGSENMVLLDGVPLIGAVHFIGASSAINPDAISAFDVHTGVSSARYDGALSGVIELQTSDITPSRLQLTGALSSTDVRSVARAPLGASGGLLLGARASFRNLFSDAQSTGSSTGYQDFITAGHIGLGRGTLSIVGFESGNHLLWQTYDAASTTTAASLVQLSTVPTTLGTPTTGDAANWQSGAFGTTWTLPVGLHTEWRTVGWWTGSTATITSAASSLSAHLASGISEFGATTELRTQQRNSSIVIGGELTRPRTWYTIAVPATAVDSAVNLDLRSQPFLGSIYGEWDWHGTPQFDLRAGLRANTNFTSAPNLDPRLVVNVRTSPTTRIEAGFGRTHQSVQSMLNEENLTSAIIGPALPVAASTSLGTARSDQWELSIEHQVGSAVSLSLDGYVRDWENVLTPTASTGALFAAGAPLFGGGKARGLIASIAAERGRFSVHASAGLASATQQVGTVTYHTGFEQP